jgi:glycosyltransferase involved in cell wall biosynthesis
MNQLVDILLPAFNGEKYLSEQIDSLLRQSYSNWRLIIRDDLSTDGTVSLINEYRDKYPDMLLVLDSQSIKLGVTGSYECLMHASTARYVAFCDQDDVWHADKLLLQMEKMQELEELHGNAVPILVHTDLTVVDKQLELLGSSFWSYQHLNPAKMTRLSRMLVQNCITGCAAIVNRPLIDLALPIPEEAIMHDWWLGLIAVSEGVVSHIKTPTVKYRQHDNNDTGAMRWSFEFIIKTIRKGRASQMRSLLNTRVQAEALLNTDVLNDAGRRTVDAYVSLYRQNWFMRRIVMIRKGFFKYGIIRNIAMFLRI